MKPKHPAARAVESAEYMAKSAERYIDAVNSLDSAQNAESDLDQSVEDAEAEMAEALGRLRSDIYEFRKRRDAARGNPGLSATPRRVP